MWASQPKHYHFIDVIIVLIGCVIIPFIVPPLSLEFLGHAWYQSSRDTGNVLIFPETFRIKIPCGAEITGIRDSSSYRSQYRATPSIPMSGVNAANSQSADKSLSMLVWHKKGRSTPRYPVIEAYKHTIHIIPFRTNAGSGKDGPSSSIRNACYISSPFHLCCYRLFLASYPGAPRSKEKASRAHNRLFSQNFHFIIDNLFTTAKLYSQKV